MAKNTRSDYSNRPEVTAPTEGEWKGNPTLSLPSDDPKWPITMGIKKWRFVVRHLAAVQAFVAKHPEHENTEEAAMAALGITPEQLAALRAAK
jgi:hypothetical protein